MPYWKMKIIDKSSVAQQLVELIAAVALENFSARFNLAFGIEPEGTLHLAAKHCHHGRIDKFPL